MGLMGCSATNARGMHDGTKRAAVNIADEVLDTLEHW